MASPVMGIIGEKFNSTPVLKRWWGERNITIKGSRRARGSLKTIQILASENMNGAVLQCGAIASRSNGTTCYSKFAVLEVVSPSEQPTSEQPTSDISSNQTNATTSPTPPNY